MEIKIETDKKRCEEIWRALSPQFYLYDDWDFRKLFADAYGFPLYFIVGYEQDMPVALLPLEFDTEKRYYEYWGGFFMEFNRVFVRPGANVDIQLLYDAVPKPMKLVCAESSENKVNGFVVDGFTYTLDIQNMQGVEDYLLREFSAKRRKNIRNTVDKALVSGLVTGKGDWRDLSKLFQYNIDRFADESSFHDQHEQEIFKQFASLSLPWEIVVLRHGEEVVAVSIGCLYKDRYQYLAVGSDFARASGAGTVLWLEHVTRAIQYGAKFIDAGSHDCGWKELWHLTKIPLFDRVIL